MSLPLQIQQAVTTFESFLSDMRAHLDRLKVQSNTTSTARAQQPSFSLKVGFHADPRIAALSPLLTIQQLGALTDAVGLSCVALEVAAQATRDAPMLNSVTSVASAATRMHRWCVGQLKAKAAQVLTVPM